MGLKDLVHAVSVPMWDRDVQQEQLTFAAATFQTLTIPTGATAVLISVLEPGTEQMWVSPVTTDPSGIRIGGGAASRLLFRLGPSATIRVKGNTGTGQIAGAAYFFGNPPAGGAGGNSSPLDVPVWDDRILNEQFSTIAGGATSKLTVPATAKFFSVSVLEIIAPNEAYLSISATDDTGIKFGGDTGTPIIHRINQPELSRGRVTTANGAGDTLIDANATFLSDVIAADDTITNMSDGLSRGRVVTVDSDTQITCVALAGGTQDDFDVGEVYTIRQTPPMHVHNPDAGAIDVGVLYFAE